MAHYLHLTSSKTRFYTVSANVWRREGSFDDILLLQFLLKDTPDGLKTYPLHMDGVFGDSTELLLMRHQKDVFKLYSDFQMSQLGEVDPIFTGDAFDRRADTMYALNKYFFLRHPEVKTEGDFLARVPPLLRTSLKAGKTNGVLYIPGGLKIAA